MMVKLPVGVTIYVGPKPFKGQIPENLCPPKYLKAANDDKSKGTGGKRPGNNA